MFNISSFLEKFSKNIQSTELNNEQIIQIIEKNTQIKINPNEMEIKNYIIWLKSSPGVKNKIFINKAKILEEINFSLSIKIVDIK